ncbi:tubulin binding protein [Planoprotostelium fungivorum]|uniref:Tubulin binding protein n=1 Tax=Planoprotostelium fungivorum TaxID=1890364 RepID=A0A2P6N0Y6_9EUKA|nr:tubulin binding protein [Planoprotostelium fungivorum]
MHPKTGTFTTYQGDNLEGRSSEGRLLLLLRDPLKEHNSKKPNSNNHTNANMQKIKNLLHRHHEEPHHAPAHTTHTHAPLAHVEPVPVVEVIAKKDMHDDLLVKKTEVVERDLLDVSRPAEVTHVELMEATTATVRAEPVNVQHLEKEVVVHEHIHPVEKEEIQPIIHREREQMEVKQITERLHETEIAPTLVEKRELAPEVREVIVEKAAPIPENLVVPTVEVDATLRSVEMHAPIVNEVVKKTIIEEIQPVLEKDVIVPTLVQKTLPIYEKIVEAPVVIREELPVREITHVSEVKVVETEVLKGKSHVATVPLVL